MTTSCYTACSCNRVPYCADWGTNGLLCFGTRNAVAIYEPCEHIGRVTHTLHRHRDRIVTVHWVKPGDGAPESELLSGSVDGTVIIWSRHHHTFQCTSVLNVENAVTFADSLQLSNSVPSTSSARLLVCTGSISGNVKLWLREENADAKHFQTIDFGRKLPIHCRLTWLPDNKCPLLAVTLEDTSILLYTTKFDVESELEPCFVKVQRLVGHTDWVTCMDFTRDGNGNLFLATGSKDSMIRLWKIGEAVEESSSDELKLESNNFTIDHKQYDVTLESVLCGHESWVYGLHWQPMKTDKCQTMKLLSASMDKTMIIWEPAELMNGMWTETVRVGEVGGNSMGFYGCKFGPDEQHILAYGYQGSFHIWKYCQEMSKWLPRSTPGGHFSEVVDLCWEPKGRFV